MKTIAAALLLLLIATAHVIAIFLLYRGRSLGRPLCESDFIVFILPSALAFVAYYAAARWLRPSATFGVTLAAAATAASFVASLIVAFNTYGT